MDGCGDKRRGVGIVVGMMVAACVALLVLIRRAPAANICTIQMKLIYWCHAPRKRRRGLRGWRGATGSDGVAGDELLLLLLLCRMVMVVMVVVVMMVVIHIVINIPTLWCVVSCGVIFVVINVDVLNW